MTNLSKKLDQLIKNSKTIMPVKTEQGILVGDVLIVSDGSIKNLYQNETLKYQNIHLNVATIAIANLLARRVSELKCQQIYRADQEYGKWFVDSQFLRNKHEKALQNQDYDRADMFWARYIESRDRTAEAKKSVEFLCRI